MSRFRDPETGEYYAADKYDYWDAMDDFEKQEIRRKLVEKYREISNHNGVHLTPEDTEIG